MTRINSESYELGVVTLRARTTTGGAAVASTAGTGMNGTYCLALSAQSASYTNTGADPDIYVSGFIRVTTMAAVSDAAGQSKVMTFSTVSAAEIASLRLNGITGHFALYTDTGTLVATGTANISAATTYHVQVRHKVDNATGVLELYVNGTLDATFTGDTQPGAETYDEYFTVVSVGGGHQLIYDDVLQNNSLGSEDNTYTGIRRIAAALVPTGVGFYVNNWSRNIGGTNWECVDEIPNDGDTTYIFTGSANIYESFSMSDQSLSNVNYLALTTNAVVKKDSGTVQLAIGIRDVINSVNYYGANSALGVSYGLVSERRTTDPAGGSWTSGRINSVEALVVSTAV